MIQKTLSLPTQFEGFRHILEQSAVEYMKVHAQREAPYITNSKLGGYPYLPRGASHPRDDTGKYMILLAQINFSEAAFPAPFPKDGLLQIFISPFIYQQALGANGCVPPSFFKVRYFPVITTDDLITDFSYLQNSSFQNYSIVPQCPIDHELSLEFSKEVEPISATDYRLHHFISIELAEQFTDIEQQPFNEVYLQHFSSAEHKIGGYPYFIAEDPRAERPSMQKYDTLLLQIVSDDAKGIMWGDSGVVKFFISHKHLETCNFTDILFYLEDY
ncbi:YwqG family protein [Lysinibacillus sp. 3P01SB]|uniref:YwqG family protein n=1 Tax=Lysinibacillus sp. 3P01SB TaxID=3132284 RepID=UPI0039A71946